MRIHIRTVAALIGALASAVSGQSPDSVKASGPRIIGVYDSRTGDPLAGVQVRDAFSGTYAMTTVTGSARLNFLTFRGDAALIELRKLGYEAKQVVVSRADTTPITEVLEAAVTLAPVITTGAYRLDRDAGLWAGFERRCQSKSVTCFRNEDLEKKMSANLADVLIHAPGITMGSCGGGGGRGNTRNSQCGKIAMRPAVIPPAYCQPTFFIDGFEWSANVGAPIDLSPGAPPAAPYTPTDVKAVEVYPPSRARPPRFQGGDPACGVVVIWTK